MDHAMGKITLADSIELSAEAVTLRGEASVLVDELTLTVRGGEMLGITGPSGSGKTLLLLAMAGLAAPESGRLRLNGRPVSLWRDVALGLVLQNLHLMPMLTAHETVALPLQSRGLAREETAERADRTLALLGLADHGGQLVQELSGGQRQRVAIARALACTPDFFLADEPTTALDPRWAAEVLSQLQAVAERGAVVIIASSDADVLARCGQIVTLG
jgi:ABC-type lipoprotein export system ATPase subunit